MKRNVVQIDVDVLKKLIDEKYDGSSMKMGRELALGQIVKNAVAEGEICEAYARLIKFETGVDIIKHLPVVDEMSTDEKIKCLEDAVDSLYDRLVNLEERFYAESETQLHI